MNASLLWKCIQFFVGDNGLLKSRGYTFKSLRFMRDERLCTVLFNNIQNQSNNTKASKKKPVQTEERQYNWMDGAIYGKDNNNRTFAVVFLPHVKKNEVLQLQELDVHRLIVCSSNLTSASERLLSKKYKVEKFLPIECVVDAVHHIAQPSIKLSSKEAAEKVIGTTLKLTRIKLHDPIIKFFGYSIGDVVEIERSKADGFNTEYRVVVA